MYRKHFSLHSLPFKTTPDLSMFYKYGSREEILEALLYTVSRGDGIVKVTGEVGSGKTMLLRLLASKLSDDFEVIYINSPNLSSTDILLYICSELNIDVADTSHKFHLTNALKSKLVELHAAGKRVVMLIDEAQSMTFDALEEIRLLSNIETGESKLLQIVLFGQPELDVALDNPKIRQLKSRISYSMYVPALSPEEVQTYLNYRMRKAGYDDIDVFNLKVAKKIHGITSGLPRNINVVADKVLMSLFGAGERTAKLKHLKNLPELEGSDGRFSRAEKVSFLLLLFLLIIIIFLSYTLVNSNINYFQGMNAQGVNKKSVIEDTNGSPQAHLSKDVNVINNSPANLSGEKASAFIQHDTEKKDFVPTVGMVNDEYNDDLKLGQQLDPNLKEPDPSIKLENSQSMKKKDELDFTLVGGYSIHNTDALIANPDKLKKIILYHSQGVEWLKSVDDRYVVQLSTRHIHSLDSTLKFYEQNGLELSKLHVLLDFNNRVQKFRLKVFYLQSSRFSELTSAIDQLPYKVKRSSPYIVEVQQLLQKLDYTDQKLKEVGILHENTN
jgi:type II secretory pathway predicted ATPase ExeA